MSIQIIIDNKFQNLSYIWYIKQILLQKSNKGIFITAGTILLWMTYIDIKKTLDKTDPNQLLEEAVRNERAFLAFSIIATIITVSVIL